MQFHVACCPHLLSLCAILTMQMYRLGIKHSKDTHVLVVLVGFSKADAIVSHGLVHSCSYINIILFSIFTIASATPFNNYNMLRPLVLNSSYSLIQANGDYMHLKNISK